MKITEKIYVAGHQGLVGSAIVRQLKKNGYTNIITKTKDELDLTDQKSVNNFFNKERPDYVFLAAAKVGGIYANMTYPADFILQNILISTNIINAAHQVNVKKLCNLGSSCIYPKNAPQPMLESALLTSELEKTNEAYAVAKIASIKLCHYFNIQYGTNYISLMPTNQYGIGDNFNMETAHLLPMILRRFHLAKLISENNEIEVRNDLAMNPIGWGLDRDWESCSWNEIKKVLSKIGVFQDHVSVWGDGSVYRELMCSDDLADACIYLMNNVDIDRVGELVNITTGTDIQLADLFKLVKDIVKYQGYIVYDKTKPNGTPRKLMDATKIKKLGWQPKTTIKDGISNFYKWYKSQSI